MATLLLIWVRKIANVCMVKAGCEHCGEKCCRDKSNAIPLTFHSSVFFQPSGPHIVAAPTPAEAWRMTAGAAAVGAWRSCLILVLREQRSRR